MKSLGRILLTIILTYFFSIYFPWWSLFVVAFLVGLVLHGPGLNTFIGGFIGVGLVWIGQAALITFSYGDDFINKFTELIDIGIAIDSNGLIGIIGLIGAICGGFAAATGSSFRAIFLKKKGNSLYSS